MTFINGLGLGKLDSDFYNTLLEIVMVNCNEFLQHIINIVTVNCSEFLKHSLSNYDGELQ